jgi:CheY-like chemotaxis protein
MSGHPDAFLSYTRIDDEFRSGAITSLRRLLELGVQVVTGNRNFQIFQDKEGIELGQNWQHRLDQAITDARFLIPILSPLYFQSKGCRDELTKFIAYEKSLGRNDLILPVYFVTTPLLEKPDLLKDDVLASKINERQRYDWLPYADLPTNDPQIRPAVIKLAEKISEALSRKPDVSQITPPKEATRGSELEHVARASTLESAFDSIKIEETQDELKKGRRRILWVDDKPNNNIYERRSMEAYHIDFDLAVSTREALAKIELNKFDAIISDMNRVPDRRAGYTLLGALRGRENRTPFFIYAGADAKRRRNAALARGADGSTNDPAELIADVLKAVGLVEELPSRRGGE